jgi:hypothetical protein
MNKTLKWGLIGSGIVVVGASLVFGGFGLGQTLALRQFNTGYGVMGPGMMTRFNGQAGEDSVLSYGPGMMGGYYGGPSDESSPYDYGMMGGGMMTGMMGSSTNSGLLDVEPLSVEEAQFAIEDYLITLGNEDLELYEVMIFDNHAYGEIVEKSSGIGAMEVLVDPVTKAVYPEHGPNIMWNLKYSPMGTGGYGMMGRGMMGGFGWQGNIDPNAEMTVSEDEAVEAAQEYLDDYLPGTAVDEHADPFYGYYTLHVTRDGEIVGMLSVNGFSSEVFLHTWHGDFIEMAE